MFRVQWEQNALASLTNAWLQGDVSTRESLTLASAQLDNRLAADPVGESESRPDGCRIAFEYPLGALIHVDGNTQLVSVLRIWLYHRGRK